MGTVQQSFDNIIKSAVDNGALNRFLGVRIAATTSSATTSCGYIDCQRAREVFTFPSLSGGLTNWLTTVVKVMALGGTSSTGGWVAGLEYELGSLNMNTGTFTSGVSMPSKTVLGASLTTASLLSFLVCTSTVTGTNPLITTTYTDQDGNGSASCAMTIPTSTQIDSAFLMTPHLANGDTGIRSVSNMTKSAGTAGTIVVKGLLPIGIGMLSSSNDVATIPLKATCYPDILCGAGETVAFYRIGGGGAINLGVLLGAVADN